LLEKYLKEDKTLDYQKIYNDMAKIVGLDKDKQRDRFYHNIVGMYENYKKNSKDS
jgi:hypothetical protein